jgi:GNAT superfamily N-acetyltransferase
LDAAEILEIFDREARRDAVETDSLREATPEIVRAIIPHEQVIVVVYSDLSEANADAVIEREVAYAQRRGLRLSWKMYTHDQPADLHERLVAHGFQAQDLEAVMALDLAAAPAELLAPLPELISPGVEIRRITGPENIGDVIEMEEAVWGSDHSWLNFMAGQLRDQPDMMSMYCAYVDGMAASAGWIRFPRSGQFASLWGGSTLPAYRQRGLYTALLAIRTQEAIRRGYRFLTIDASPMSRPIVEKHGFRLLTQAQDHDWGTAAGN